MIGPVRSRALLLFAVSLLLVAGCGGSSRRETPGRSARAGIHKIRHVIVIMQENRSFDHYFGTYPGADGIPRRNGKFTVCVPDSYLNRCIKPYHDHARRNIGGTHDHVDALGDVAPGAAHGGDELVRLDGRASGRGACARRPSARSRSARCPVTHSRRRVAVRPAALGLRARPARRPRQPPTDVARPSSAFATSFPPKRQRSRAIEGDSRAPFAADHPPSPPLRAPAARAPTPFVLPTRIVAPLRALCVYQRLDAGWKLIQMHVSNAVSNG